MHGPRLSNVQWYLNRSKHIAYMAFLVPGRMTRTDCMDLAGALMSAFPRLSYHVDLDASQCFEICPVAPEDALSVLPDGDLLTSLKQQLSELTAPFEPGSNQTFHCSRMYSAEDDKTLLFFSAPHSAMEGLDAMRMGHKDTANEASGWTERLLSLFLPPIMLPVSILQIAFAPAFAKPRSRFTRRIVSIDRHAFRQVARKGGASWHGLLNAIVADATCGQWRRAFGMPRVSAVTEFPEQASRLDDSSITFRMRFGLVRQSRNLFRMAVKYDQRLFSATKRRLALHHFISAGLGFHRKMASMLPALYPERSFQYFPAALSFSVMPPPRLHRFEKLANPELCVAGSNTPGLTSAIVTASNRRLFLSLNLPGDGTREISRANATFEDLGIKLDVIV